MTAPSPALELATSSPEDTRSLGAALAGVLRPGDVVLLAGDLGTGKTTLTQGIAAGLGVTGPVTSPTFTLVRSHAVHGTPNGVRTLLHADLYRLEHLAEVADLAIGELVEDGAVAIVEWGDAGAPVLGEAVVVTLAVPDDPPRGSPGTNAGAGPELPSRRACSVSLPRGWRERCRALSAALGRWTSP